MLYKYQNNNFYVYKLIRVYKPFLLLFFSEMDGVWINRTYEL